MKIVGLITEYNPFHNGHKYHIEKAKEVTGADYVIAIMSGDFVQRGAPAFLPKHLRTDMALDGGCDLVLELPVCFATGSAEYFASGAIGILNNLGCIDSICFGSECGDYDSLEEIAQVLVNEPDKYKVSLQEHLRNGLSFPLARQQALKKYFGHGYFDVILEEPNNILGIEYIKALILRNSSMKGYTITRKDSSYHNTELSRQFSSASAIRNIFSKEKDSYFDKLYGHMSEHSIDLMIKAYGSRYPVYSDDFSLLLRYKLLSETSESLTEYLDITSELANRIINFRNDFINFSQFCELLKTKELTYSRISRSLFHIILNIKKCNPASSTYARVLGFKKDSSELFSKMKHSSKIPIITKLTATYPLSKDAFEMLKQDIYASELYENVISHKFQKPFINELTKQIIKM